MIKRQTNETLRSDMWRACDILRRDNNVGGIMQYTEHIAWLLFLKFLDEEEKERTAQASLGSEPYEPVLRGDLAWDTWASPQVLKAISADDLIRYVRGRLLPGLASLSGSPLARTIAGIFSDESVADHAVVRNVPVCASGYNFKDVLDIVNSIRFESDQDIFTITQFYEDLLERMGNENLSAGEFHTPRPVIRFMVDVIAPQIGEEIYDPASGSAGFLAEAYEYMADVKRNPNQTIQDREFLQEKAFYGQEKKGLSALLGTMNMVLHRVGAPNIIRTNTLEESVKGSVSKRYDVILTNPPFGKKSSVTFVSEEGEARRESQVIERGDFVASTSNKQLNFVQHIKTILKINGRAAVVVPDNVLFEGGAGETIRRKLLTDFDLHTMLRLPTGIFYAQGVKANVLFFDKKVARPGQPWTERLWVYDLRTNKHFTLKQNPLRRADLDDFVTAYQPGGRGQREEGERWKSFSYDEIMVRDKANLDITWLRDESLEDLDNLPSPEVLAREIVEDLAAALQEFEAVATALEEQLGQSR